MTALATFAKMLGINPRIAEDALHSDRAARVALSRRNLFAAAGAMATGTAFGFAAPAKVFGWDQVRLTFAPGSDLWLMAEAVTGLCSIAHENLSIATGIPFSREGLRLNVFEAFRDAMAEFGDVEPQRDLAHLFVA
jgi:hypothetical protein